MTELSAPTWPLAAFGCRVALTISAHRTDLLDCALSFGCGHSYSMRIIADRNIPRVEAAFAHLGDVRLVDGRGLRAAQVSDADLLLVRSVTPVNAALLQDSQVRLVASATIGTDHIDFDFLNARGIRFANAPGCNATSAAEYVIAALLQYCEDAGERLGGKHVAVVGYGNVGSRVVQKLLAFDCEVSVFDPPRQAHFADRAYVDWDTVCDADIVTAHVPLTVDGPHPTLNMFDADFFARLTPGAVFINTARGKAVDEAALLRELQHKPLYLMLDVWRNEPNIDLALLTQTRIGTPHIAGYSIEGKLRGTEMIYQAACAFLGVAPQWSMTQALEQPVSLRLADYRGSASEVLRELVNTAYPILEDDARLRELQRMDEVQRGAYFDKLRKTYPVRHEFAHYHIQPDTGRVALTRQLQALGFTLTD